MDQTTSDATLIYQYHHMSMRPRPSSAIFCLCSLDLRVARHAAQLYLDGLAPILIFSGNSGKLTQSVFTKPEAHVFADVARSMGVPEDKIIVEAEATNTGENVRFTYDLLQERGLLPESLILVQKPYMERRTFATFKKQWPDETVSITVTSPPFSFEEYPDENNPRDLVINVMVGDLYRIKDYPPKGYQIPQEIPDLVWEAMQRLIKAGYDKHLPEGITL